jgi:hypothetical protein
MNLERDWKSDEPKSEGKGRKGSLSVMVSCSG